MNIFVLVMICLYLIIDAVLVKRYEKKIKLLTDENKQLKKTLDEIGD